MNQLKVLFGRGARALKAFFNMCWLSPSRIEAFFNQDIVELVGHQYISQPTGLIGSGGVECWIFQAQNAGGTEIQLAYRRPWESAGIPPARTATYYVSVNQ